MTTNENQDPIDRAKTVQATYYLNGLLFVPHASRSGMYVAPGGRQESEAYLKALGAECVHQPLFTRRR